MNAIRDGSGVIGVDPSTCARDAAADVVGGHRRCPGGAGRRRAATEPTVQYEEVGDTPVSVCGEAASDPQLAVVLTGLGVSSLSLGAGALAGVGAQLASVDLATARTAAAAALAAGTPDEARAAVRAALG